jgi:SAM-dependent methyltransferase
MDKQIKSKQRVASRGEVFTAAREVNAMLDLVKQETERIDSRFLEPACGDGNFLAEILRRKLEVVKRKYRKNPPDYELYAVLAITSIYGIDICSDNVTECRARIFEIFDKEYTFNCKKAANNETREAVIYILRRNIVCGDALSMKTENGEPIAFSQWEIVTGSMLKRIDYRYDQLLENEYDNSKQMQIVVSDTKIEAVEIGRFPPTYYRRVQQYE